MAESNDSAISGSEGERGDETVETITLLGCGRLFSYTVPSFPVYKADLRRIWYECEDLNGSVKIVDGFIRDDPSLARTYPTTISVVPSYKDAFLIDAEEFNRSIDITAANLVEGSVFVIWKWKWIADESEHSDSGGESSTGSVTVVPETPLGSGSETELDVPMASMTIGAAAVITHTVTFKCIGCTKEHSYQETLVKAAQILKKGDVITCTLVPEPQNPVDARAVAFKCKVDGCWQRIGYVVKEAQEEVHDALEKKEVSRVAFDWIKFIIYWRQPGWYAGINLTRIGEWSDSVTRSQSAKMR